MKKLSNSDYMKIELQINRCLRESEPPPAKVLGKVPAHDIDIDYNVMSAFHNLQAREDFDFVKRHLIQRGYTRKTDCNFENDKDFDYERFINDAVIEQSVWSRYKNGKTTRTSHDTLLKIVLGLRLTEAEAREYLSMAGSGFALATDYLDCIILSYIRLDYLKDESTEEIANTVASILQFYSDNTDDQRLKNRLSNFYGL